MGYAAYVRLELKVISCAEHLLNEHSACEKVDVPGKGRGLSLDLVHQQGCGRQGLFAFPNRLLACKEALGRFIPPYRTFVPEQVDDDLELYRVCEGAFREDFAASIPIDDDVAMMIWGTPARVVLFDLYGHFSSSSPVGPDKGRLHPCGALS